MFNKMFNANNPFWKSMDTVFDLFILNALVIFCSIPVFTLGPALTAFHFTLTQRCLGEEGTVFNDFFRSFRQNFKQGVLLGVPMTLVGAFLLLDMYLCRKMGTGIYTFFIFFFMVIFVIWFFIFIYAFPLLAKFERSNKEILIWAFTLSLSKLPQTLFMSLITIGGLWFCKFLPGLIFIMFGLIGQCCSPIITSFLKPYIDAANQTPEEDDMSEYQPVTQVLDSSFFNKGEEE